MKKLISLFVLLGILFNISIVSYSKEVNEQTDDRNYVVAEKLLSDLGVYSGVEAYTASDGFVRRDIFAILITRLMNIEDSLGSPGNYGLLDVKADTFGAENILTLMSMGIIDIPKNGYYYPEKYITYKEATKILVEVLGYDSVVYEKTLDNFFFEANKIGLLKNVTFSKDERLQVKQLTKILYNALQIDSMGVTFDKGNIKYSTMKDTNLLSSTYNLKEIEGIVTANSITNLNFGSKTSLGSVMIDNVVYDAGETNAEELLGYRVKAYCDIDDDTIVSINGTWYTDEVILDVDDLEYNNQTYTRYTEKRKKNYVVSSKADIIYNNEACVYDKALMVPREGSVKLLDQDSDKKYEVVIITSTESKVVQEYSKNGNTVSFKYSGGSINFDDMDEENIKVVKADGSEGKITALSEWVVVDVCISPSSEYIVLYLNSTKVKGTVQSIENQDGRDTVTVDGTQYEISDFYPNDGTTKIQLGASGTFYLNRYGRIAAVNVGQTDWYYGYIIKTIFDDSGEEDGYTFKIYSEEGKGSEKKFYSAKKIRIDNVSCGRDGFNSTGTNVIEAKLKTQQLIRYKRNIDGEITDIDTVDTAADEVGLRLDVAEANRKFRNNQFYGLINLNSSTKIFVIPNSTLGDDLNDPDLFAVKDYSYFKADEYHVVTSYITEPDSLVASAIVAKRRQGVSYLGSVMVKDISVVYDNSKDESYEKIIGCYGSTTIEYFAEIGFCESKNITVGDIVAFSVSPTNVVDDAVIMYDRETGVANSTYSSRSFDADVKLATGYAYNKSQGIVQLSSTETSLASAIKIGINSTTVIVYDGSLKEPVYEGNLKDIADYKHNQAADVVVCFLQYQQIRTAFVYKK